MHEPGASGVINALMLLDEVQLRRLLTILVCNAREQTGDLRRSGALDVDTVGVLRSAGRGRHTVTAVRSCSIVAHDLPDGDSYRACKVVEQVLLTYKL